MKLNQLRPFLLTAGLIIMTCMSFEKGNNPMQDQEIYFEHYAINYAWGLSYCHWIIDYEGNIRVNKRQDSIIWINPNDLNDYTRKFDSIIHEVDKNELDYYIQLISNASKGEIIESPQDRRDFGGTVFNCYMADKVRGNFKMILLSEMSDNIDRFNSDSSAIIIDKWLKDLHVEIYSNK